MEHSSENNGQADITIQNDVMDSTRWDNFPIRDSDIIIATFGKTGTTWVQQIVGQLVFGGGEHIDIGSISPWIEYRGTSLDNLINVLQSQRHRRFFKTHLPKNALPYFPRASYIYVARDARDQIWSAYDHLAKLRAKALLSGTRDADGSALPPIADVRSHYLHLLSKSGSSIWGYWPHVSSWWSARHLPNVLLVHYSNLKDRLPQEIERIANFLGIGVTDSIIGKAVEHASFAYMKKNSAHMAGPATAALKGGASALFNHGLVGRWKRVLSAEEIRRCDEVASKFLSPDCARWLSTGHLEGPGG